MINKKKKYYNKALDISKEILKDYSVCSKKFIDTIIELNPKKDLSLLNKKLLLDFKKFLPQEILWDIHQKIEHRDKNLKRTYWTIKKITPWISYGVDNSKNYQLIINHLEYINF